ncbi:hypothetical protein OAU56_00465 [Nitrosopumilus sp.]|jgi:hypothetical protein|nr:hypothetical protein [Nitrosopumilus sp.]MDC0896780.1 hypothetical protein [Nitrosopumilus sp.]MDC1103248.1 hypothetical protein [Nitrosopumilus sp.]MDC3291685.1 hypothetical protein [Nitrosopumilus sp.]MDO7697975.1 hypothetical protein [Nitrosopumilus sp.]|tara:strand:+ start:298 stop:675 length:378 start_codon:yes stop_codon:yes gene_type:complete
MQDPNPLPWGALDRYQAQFIVRKNAGSSAVHYTAKTSLTTQGHFGSKIVTKVAWNGYGDLATKLNSDTELNEMIAKQSIKDATIYVEPTDTAIRIRSKWDNHIAFGITKELFEIYDRIAGHIKSV